MKKTLSLTDRQSERLAKLAEGMKDDERWGINIRAARRADQPNVVAIAAMDEGISALEKRVAENGKAPKEAKGATSK